jgi:anaerobic magnesium-protoporphyrin IX monomethyl ester cyclase
MAKNVDVLFIHPGDRQQAYQNLGDEFCAIEPPVFAGLFATYARKKYCTSPESTEPVGPRRRL